MFLKILKDNFHENEPIFISEIVPLFKYYSNSYIFRHLNMALRSHQLNKFSNGVYYLPNKNMDELSPLEVIKKRFISYNHEIYGIFSGSILLNSFLLNKQINDDIEIISNKETSRSRKIKIKNVSFIIKKSRLKITNENYKIYTLLEFFLILKPENEKDLDIIAINNYIKENNIKKENLYDLLYKFPLKVVQKVLNFEIMK